MLSRVWYNYNVQLLNVYCMDNHILELCLIYCSISVRIAVDMFPAILQVMLLTFVLMIAFALLIWGGRGDNPINSSLMARVCIYIFIC